MNRIQVLDKVTVDKIAAGEVIERPASIVKELVENAVDAGATAVTVEIREGGISFIRITDNGCGILREDVANAFLRHSTSKIRTVEDLAHIHSLGFRGEALSSIAAVSRVELITRPKEADCGVSYRIEGGEEISLEETGAPDGTTFLVRQLFYNTPARRKFLKTPMTEASHVADLVTRLALSHPEISFQFINNGQSKIHTSGNGNLRDVIYHLYGRDIASHLLPVRADDGDLTLTGFLGEPLISRGNRNFENYFINGRYIKSSLISKAIEDAYRDFTMQHKYPFAVLHLTADGEMLDVNVHPTKMEVRFGNQQRIYNFLSESIGRVLHGEELIPQVEAPEVPKAPQAVCARQESHAPRTIHGMSRMLQTSETKQKPEPQRTPGTIPDAGNVHMSPERKQEDTKLQSALCKKESTLCNANNIKQSTLQNKQITLCGKESALSGNRDLNYFMEKMRERVTAKYEAERTEEEKTPYQPERPELQKAPEPAGRKDEPGKPKQLDLFEERLLDRASVREHRIIGQLFDTYWLVEFHDSLYIIDQHAAHERVLYEKTLRGMKTREYTSQNISPPIVLELSMGEAELLNTYMDQFTRIGFEIESFGPDSFAVCAIPDNLFGIAKKELLMEMIDSLSDEITTGLTPDIIDEKIASMSCKAAVKGNMRLSAAEADALIGELLQLENPYHCPHGRPTIISMTKRELEKKFKRIV